MATTTKKTWLEVKKSLDETYNKWTNIELPGFTIITPVQIDGKPLPRGWATKPGMTDADRAVTVEFIWHDRMERVQRKVRITANKGPRPLDNLARIANAIETMRLAEGRSTHKIMMQLYRQMYPEARTQEPPRQPPSKQAPSSGPYATLHIANDAPLEVAEAAYKALARIYMPQITVNQASHDSPANLQMKALNLAIEQIREVKTK